MSGIRPPGVGILGTGIYLPEKRLTNQDLEKMVDTTDEWIFTRTGIRERRIAAKGQASSDLSLPASQEALKAAGVRPEDVDLIIVATTTPDMIFPSTSCILQDKLGANKAGAFDLSAACAGFVYAVNMAYHSIASGAYRYVLVVGTDVLSSAVDWTDRNTCVLFGDGAGAALLGPVEKGKGIVATHIGSDGSYAGDLLMPAGGSRMPPTHETVDKKLHTIRMNGREVFKVGVNIMVDATRSVAKAAGLDVNDIDFVVPHQANIRILQSATKRLGLPEEKIVINLDRYGNMSAASVIVALHEAVGDGRIKPGHKVVLVAFGSGFAWASCVVNW